MTTRADQTHDMLESIYGDLPEMPVHTPVLRTDTHRVTFGCHGIRCEQGDRECDGTQCHRPHRNVVPLKTPRIQVDKPALRPQPASFDPVSLMGERVLVWLCLGVLGWLMVLGVVHGLMYVVDMLGSLQ